MSTEQPDAGSSAGDGNAPTQPPQSTLAGMWGRSTAAPGSAAPKWAAAPSGDQQSTTSTKPIASQPRGQVNKNAAGPSQPRKRRKKEEKGPPQGVLLFGANGVGYGAPSLSSTPSDIDTDNKGKTKYRQKLAEGREGVAGEEGACTPGGACNGAARPRLSPDTAADAAKDHSDSEVEVTGEGRHKGTGSSKDPVRVDESPKLPKKIIFAADQKTTTHSFFTRTANPAPSSPPESGASTPSGVSNGAPRKAVHSFFATAGKGQPGQTKSGWGCCKEGSEPRAFLPFGDWVSHVNPQPTGTVAGPRRKVATKPLVDDSTFWARLLAYEEQLPKPHAQAAPEIISTVPLIMDHPAIAAVERTKIDNQQAWCDQHCPREAAAVLGNEVEAVYLRDWLKALSVGAIDGKRVIRKVHRRKAVNPELSWIVDDAGLFGDPLGDAMYEDDEIPEPVEEPPLPLGARPDSYPIIGNWVSNTILLTGPSGSGKSAAVHAAAAELGWGVFEVYPGIGKRTGPNLMSLVGDVGKNHTVTREKKAEKKASAANAIKALFHKAQKSNGTPPPPKASQGSASDPIDLDDVGQGDPDIALAESAKAVTDSHPADAKPQQSLILIDEADILFDEESSFWPALVSLIAESRRPIVITCNDIGRIPLQTLPLQTILHFKPAPSYLAAPYLTAIAKRHGVVRDPTTIWRQQPQHPDLIDQPLPPNGNEPAEIFDLRASITQLQLDRGLPQIGPTVYLEPPTDLSLLVSQLDGMSFADAFVAQRDWGRLEESEIDRYSPTEDDEETMRQLLKPYTQDCHPVLAVCDRSNVMADTVIALSGGVLPSHGNVQYEQTKYIRHVLPLLDELVFLSGRLLPHPSLFLELIPFVRDVVRADDILAIEDSHRTNQGEPRINRRTGRLMRTGRYERWLDLPEDLLDIARYGGLEA